MESEPLHFKHCLDHLGRQSKIFGPKPCCCRMLIMSMQGWARAGVRNREDRARQKSYIPFLCEVHNRARLRAIARHAKMWTEADVQTAWLKEKKVDLRDNPTGRTFWSWSWQYMGEVSPDSIELLPAQITLIREP